jgi:mono/diheme cytochrome c family protein
MGNGGGQPGVVPPLAKSELVNGGSKRVLMIVLKGLKGPIDVVGAHYDSPNMQPWENSIKDDKKLAAVLTYVRSAWGNTGSPIAPEQVAEARKEFANQKTQWNSSEVMTMPADSEEGGGAAAPAPAAAPAKAP